MRRAKIVCTLGPATDTPERARALVEAGMDVARLNFSHGEHADHGRRFHEVRQAAEAAGRNVAVLADLQGPKIRLGRFAEGPVMWATGERIRITVEDVEGTHDRVSTTYKQLADDVRPGDRLLVDDGNVALIAVEVEDGTDVVCDVTEGGMVSNNKGLSLPGVDGQRAGDVGQGRRRPGVRAARSASTSSRCRSCATPRTSSSSTRSWTRSACAVPVIAKIEKPEAVDRLEEIVLAFDGIMVARGDLGVEMPLEQVPVVQKRAVQICRDNAKPVIVATQMLESMITHSRPTRAEASDVANAVIDGADAVMLSGETSVGKYPVQAVATMSRIIRSVEASGTGARRPAAQPAHLRRRAGQGREATSATRSARWRWSRSPRPGTPPGGCRGCSRAQRLLVFTPLETVQRQMALVWGAEAHLVWTREHHRRHGAPGRLRR